MSDLFYKWKERLGVRTPVLASACFVATSLAVKVLLLVFTPILTRLLSPADYGVYTLYATVVSVSVVLASWDVTGGSLYRGLQKFGRGAAPSFLLSGILFCGSGLLLLILMYLSAPERFSELLGLPARYFPFLFAEVAGTLLLAFSSASCRYYYHPGRHAVTAISVTLSSLLLAVFFIRFTGLRAEARPFASAIMTTIIGIIAVICLLWGKKAKIYPPAFSFFLRFSVPLFPHALALSFLTAAPRLFVGKMLGTADLSAFGLAVSVGLAPCFLTTGISSAYGPWVLRKTAAGKHRVIGKSTFTLAVFIGCVTLSLVLLSREILSFLAPAAYRTAEGLVGAVSLSVLPLFFYSVTANAALCREHTARLSLSTLAVAFFAGSLYFALVPRFGITAAAWLQPASFLLLFCVHSLSLLSEGDKLPLPFFGMLLLFAGFALMTAGISFFTPPLALRLPLALLSAAGGAFFLYRRRGIFLEPKTKEPLG